MNGTMHMHYWLDTTMKNLIFEGYDITSMSGFLATCFGLASLAILLEAMRVLHASLKIDSDQSPEEETTAGRWCLPRTKLRQLSIETTCYIFEGLIGYLVMLCVMTFNGYFTIAVTCGAAIGYHVFGPQLLEIRLNARNIYWQRNASFIRTESVPSAPSSPGSIHSRDSSLSEVAEDLAAAANYAREEIVRVEVIRSLDQGMSLPPATITTTATTVSTPIHAE